MYWVWSSIHLRQEVCPSEVGLGAKIPVEVIKGLVVTGAGLQSQHFIFTFIRNVIS